MPIVEYKDIYDDSKSPFENLKKDFKELQQEVEKLTKMNYQLSQSLQKVKKTGDGEEAKQLTAATSALTKSTLKLKDAKLAEIRVKEQILKVNSKLSESNAESQKELQKLKIQTQERNKLAKQQAREELGLVSAYEKESRKLTELRKRYKDLAIQNKANTDEGKALLKNIQDLDKKLKDLDDSVGQNQRSVGAYKEAIESSLPGLAGAASGFKQMTLQALKFIATPIGAVLAAIVAAIKLLSAAFDRSIKNQEKLNIITGKLSAAFGMLLDALQPVVEFLIDGLIFAFDKAVESAGWLVEKLVQLGVINESTSKKLKKSWDENSKAADNLAASERKLIESQIQLEKLQLRYQNEAEKLRQIRDDESLSIEERIKANEKLGQVLDKQLQAEKAVALQRLKLAKDREKVYGESLETTQEIGDAEIKLLEIEERITGQRSEQLVNTNSLLKEKKALFDEINKLRQKDLEGINEIESKALQTQKDNTLENINEIFDYRKKKTDEQIQYELEAVQALEEAKKQLSVTAQNAAITILQDQFNYYQDEKLAKLQSDTEAEKQILKQRLDDGLISEEEYRRQIEKLDKKTRIEQAKAQKKEALFAIALDTATAVVKTLAKYGFTPAGWAAAAAMAGIGAAQAAVVLAKPIPKFADGEVNIEGKSHSQGGILAEIEGGESVINKKATADSEQLLTAINNGLITDKNFRKSNYDPNLLIAGLLMSGNKINEQMLTAILNSVSTYDRGNERIIIHSNGTIEKFKI